MEFLETQDPEKKKLIESSDRHKQELHRQVHEISERSGKVVKNALIIGGALAITYLLVTQITSGTRKNKRKHNVSSEEPMDQPSPVIEKSHPTFLSQVGSKIINTATLVLLDMAKDKLSDYLQNRKEKNENS